MKKALEEQLKTAVEHAVPDCQTKILLLCENLKGVDLPMTEKMYNRRKVIAIVLSISMVLLLTFGGIFATMRMQQSTVSASIEMDVNPSLKLELNGENRVINVLALNDDAEKVLGDMNLKDTDLEVATNALIGSLLKNGYLSKEANTILLSVDSQSMEQEDKLKSDLTESIQSLLKASSIEGAVLYQSMSDDQLLLEKANALNIPIGKAQFIQGIIEKYPDLTFDELAKMSVHDLALILFQSGYKTDKVNMSGQINQDGLLDLNKVKELALAASQVDGISAGLQKAELGYYKGTLAYEITFAFNGQKYSYKIDAKSGKILEQEVKPLSGEETEVSKRSSDPSDGTGMASYIGVEQAKTIALTAAALTGTNVTFTKTELNQEDNGRSLYEIKFIGPNGSEYEYKVDALSGRILESSVDGNETSSGGGISPSSTTAETRDDSPDNSEDKNSPTETRESEDSRSSSSSSQTSEDRESRSSESSKSTTAAPTYIGEGQAKSIALGAAGVAESNVSEMEVELKNSDGQAYYEVKFKSADKDYRYKVDAVSGGILG